MNKKSLVLGLTGSFCSGKSEVAKICADCGAYVIDADKIVHSLFESSEIQQQLLAEFKTIDRKEIATIVFCDTQKRETLEQLLHPLVIEKIKEELDAKQQAQRLVVIDVPLLFEVGLETIVDKVIVVKTTLEKQIQWAKKKYRISKEEIQQRIDAQLSIQEKCMRADIIIENSSTLEVLHEITQKCISELE